MGLGPVLKGIGRGAEAAADLADSAVDALGNKIGALAELFSPSLKAANEITQDKGSYEQLRAMMIKNGAKADEMEWSGADEFFQGQKTTRQEIADYLEANDPRLVPEVRQAEGVLGSGGDEAMDVREAVDQAMEDQPAYSALLDSEMVYLSDKLQDGDSGYFRPTELGDEELDTLAENLKTNTDDLRGKEWAYRNEDGSVEFFQYTDEAVQHQYGGEDALNQELNILIRESLENEFYEDPPRFINRHNLQNSNAMDMGETQYSEYFPEGGSDYTEKLFQYRDPTGRIPIDQLAGSAHFGDSDYGTIFHTRQADYPVEGGGTARYIGEIQSDPQQKVGDRTSKTYEQSLAASDLEILKEKLRGLSNEDTLIKADMFSNMDEFDRKRLGYEASIYELNQYIKLRPIAGDSRWRALNMDKYKGITEIPLSGEMTDLQEELVNNFIRMSPFRGKNWSGDVEAQSIVSKYLLSNPVDWLPNNFKNEFSNVSADSMDRALDIGEIQNEIIKKRYTAFPDDVELRGQFKGGPLMSSQNKWVDQALNQSILDAVNDPNIDYLAFPNDPDAIAKVGGLDVADVKEGTINYYQRDVQNRLKKLLKSFDKNINVSEIDMGTKEFGDFTANGIKITPEFRATVRKKGVPTMAAPFVGYGALDAISEDETMGGAI